MERYGVTGGRTVMTPFPAGFKLKKTAEEDDVLEDEERNEYQSLIGSMMYAAVHMRPDASFGVGQLARVVQRSTEEQLEVANCLVRYLGSTASAGVQFSAGGQLKQIGADGVTPGTLKLSCFTDATWASEDEDQSSVGGFVCMVGGGPVSWRSKKQSEIAQSSGEAEYMAMYHAIKEIVLLRKLLEDMGAEQEGPTPLFSDSEAAIGMANNPILNGLNKHMKIKWHWVRLMVKEGILLKPGGPSEEGMDNNVRHNVIKERCEGGEKWGGGEEVECVGSEKRFLEHPNGLPPVLPPPLEPPPSDAPPPPEPHPDPPCAPVHDDNPDRWGANLNAYNKLRDTYTLQREAYRVAEEAHANATARMLSYAQDEKDYAEELRKFHKDVAAWRVADRRALAIIFSCIPSHLKRDLRPTSSSGLWKTLSTHPFSLHASSTASLPHMTPTASPSPPATVILLLWLTPSSGYLTAKRTFNVTLLLSMLSRPAKLPQTTTIAEEVAAQVAPAVVVVDVVMGEEEDVVVAEVVAVVGVADTPHPRAPSPRALTDELFDRGNVGTPPRWNTVFPRPSPHDIRTLPAYQPSTPNLHNVLTQHLPSHIFQQVQHLLPSSTNTPTPPPPTPPSQAPPLHYPPPYAGWPYPPYPPPGYGHGPIAPAAILAEQPSSSSNPLGFTPFPSAGFIGHVSTDPVDSLYAHAINESLF
ncbi:unnamed protein product [Closterium sp. NIES-54]